MSFYFPLFLSIHAFDILDISKWPNQNESKKTHKKTSKSVHLPSIRHSQEWMRVHARTRERNNEISHRGRRKKIDMIANISRSFDTLVNASSGKDDDRSAWRFCLITENVFFFYCWRHNPFEWPHALSHVDDRKPFVDLTRFFVFLFSWFSHIILYRYRPNLRS